MGIHNRDYMRTSNRGFRLPDNWGATEIIVGINVAVFIGWAFFRNNFAYNALFLCSTEYLEQFYLWTLVTYAFSHEAPMHLLFNMFVFWSFGRFLEREWGTRPFILFYLASAFIAAVVQLFFAATGLIPSNPFLGASGSVMGYLLAFSVMMPNQRIYLFAVIPIKAIVFAGFLIAINSLGLLLQITRSEASLFGGRTAYAAHLGGALVGYLYALHLRGRINLPLPRLNQLSRRPKRRRRRSSSSSNSGAASRSDQLKPEDNARLDHLLEKVSRGGLDSLTPEERDFMIEMSRRYRR